MLSRCVNQRSIAGCVSSGSRFVLRFVDETTVLPLCGSNYWGIWRKKKLQTFFLHGKEGIRHCFADRKDALWPFCSQAHPFGSFNPLLRETRCKDSTKGHFDCFPAKQTLISDKYWAHGSLSPRLATDSRFANRMAKFASVCEQSWKCSQLGDFTHCRTLRGKIIKLPWCNDHFWIHCWPPWVVKSCPLPSHISMICDISSPWMVPRCKAKNGMMHVILAMAPNGRRQDALLLR